MAIQYSKRNLACLIQFGYNPTMFVRYLRFGFIIFSVTQTGLSWGAPETLKSLAIKAILANTQTLSELVTQIRVLPKDLESSLLLEALLSQPKLFESPQLSQEDADFFGQMNFFPEPISDLKPEQAEQVMDFVGNFPLTDVNLSAICSKIGAAQFLKLKNNKVLENLNLTGCSQLFDSTFIQLAEIHTLKKLTLDSCPRLSNETLNYLKRFPHLEVVKIKRCRRVTRAGVEQFCKEKESLELSYQGCD